VCGVNPFEHSRRQCEGSKKDYKNYLEISLGSAHELETQVLIIEMLKLGEKDIIEALLRDVDEEQKMLYSFIKAIGKHVS
jgi:four helix bundle protein